MSDTPRLRWRLVSGLVSIVALAGLSSCDDDHDCCYNYYQNSTPYQVSYGMVGASFGAAGASNPISIVQTSTVKGSGPPYSSTLMSYLYTGPGTFAAPVATTASDNPLYLAVGDLNGDGLTDLVAASYDDGALELFFNNAQAPGTFNPQVVLSSPGASQVAVADMNGDSLPDLVSADYNVSLFLQTSPGTFAAPITLYSGGANWVAVGDFNGDKLTDVVAASYEDGALEVFFNDAQAPGSFNPPLLLSSPGASQVAAADMNGDGLTDLVSADYNVSLFLQSSPGTFAAPITLYSGGANWVAVGDLNNDGIPDVALTDNVGVKVLLHTGAAGATTYAAPVSVFTATASADYIGANLIAIADVNGDGLKDLVITDPGPAGGAAPTVSVLLQDAAHPGTFLAPVAYATAPGSLAQDIVVKDLNGDGLPDIVIGGSEAVSVLLQNPATQGTFLAASNYAVQDANQVVVADVHDSYLVAGLPDIIVSTGPTHPVVNGVITNHPGVLKSIASAPGTFAALQDLP